ncbi:MAG: pyridoxine 5'-phosphate synthase [Verrucomicrobia bacterium]|nr:MAG: pyridoxine 5'-phosphate synthase [Verrucomicrobiota bacterium]
MKKRLKLGVNIDHVATIRQARGTVYPDLLEAAQSCKAAGADGVTVHLREDRRHIQDEDVWRLRRECRLPLNLEMANVPAIVRIALRVKPDEVCLVPERRRELTTEGGLDVLGQFRPMQATVARLRAAGIVVSIFIEPDPRQLEATAKLGASCVELHTGAFAEARGTRLERELRRLRHAANVAHDLGLQVNAGHGINYDNIGRILELPWLDTLNIGHSIVARAIFCGLKQAVREMHAALTGYRGGTP